MGVLNSLFQVSGILHKRVAFLVCDEKALNARTKHVRKAEKMAVPIVSFSYVEECLKQVRCDRKCDE